MVFYSCLVTLRWTNKQKINGGVRTFFLTNYTFKSVIFIGFSFIFFLSLFFFYLNHNTVACVILYKSTTETLSTRYYCLGVKFPWMTMLQHLPPCHTSKRVTYFFLLVCQCCWIETVEKTTESWLTHRQGFIFAVIVFPPSKFLLYQLLSEIPSFSTYMQ